MEYQEINIAGRIKYKKREEALRGREFKKYRELWDKAASGDFFPPAPLHIDIELSDVCNLRCRMCQHGTDNVKGSGFMDKNTAFRIINECREIGVYSIKFNWRGEATLNPFLPEAVKYAKMRGIPEVQLNTNGFPYDRDIFMKCAESGIDRIIFSVDGFSASTYESIRIGASYEEVLQNIGRFLECKKEKKSLKPFVRIQMVRTNINAHEVDDYIEYWKKLVDDVRVTDVANRGQGESLSVKDQVIIGRRRCPQPFQRLTIGCNGKVSPCCMDWFQEYVVGDVKTDKILEIWKNDAMNRIRRIQDEKKHDEISICKNCSVKESYKWRKVC